MGISKKIYNGFIKKYFVKTVIKPVNTAIINGRMLENKTALIVGASGGIGSAITKAYINNGCQVVVAGRSEEKLRSLCNEINSPNIKHYCMNLDGVENFDKNVEEIVALLGRIDIFVYSAGVHGHDLFGNVTESTWDDVMNINLKAMYFLCQSVSNYMIRNKLQGHILTVSSASCNKPGWTPYEISKNAVRSLTLGFADKLIPYGIVVNSIAPGPVATEMLQSDGSNLSWPGNPTGRMCTAEEIANIALIMVSAAGDMIVGDTFFVSGGSGTICLDK